MAAYHMTHDMTDSVSYPTSTYPMQPQSHYNHHPRTEFQSPFAFQKSLKKIDDGLGSGDVEKLCFLCKDFEDLPWKELQEFKRGLQLFSALQRVDLLSSGDVSLVLELLEAIQRRDLLRKAKEMWPSAMPSGRITPYRKLLLDIANNTTKSELSDMQAMACLPYAADDNTSTIQFLISLENHGMLAHDNLNDLMMIMPNKMNEKKIKKYLQNARPPQLLRSPSDLYSPLGGSDLKPPKYYSHPPGYHELSHQPPGTPDYHESSHEPSGADEVAKIGGAMEDLKLTEEPENLEGAETPPNLEENLTANMESENLQNAILNAGGKKTEGMDRQQSTFVSDNVTTMVSMTLPPGDSHLDNTGAENIHIQSHGRINQLGPDPNLGGTAQIHCDEPDASIQRNLERCYKMNSNPSGICLIINNDNFTAPEGTKKLKDRKGSEKDVEKLLNCFDKFNFKMIKHDNLTTAEMYTEFNKIRENQDLKDHDAFVCCILTHGKLGQLAGSNGKYLQIREIISIFTAEKCPQLAGKPKLFFLQACQGRDEQELRDIEKDCARPKKDPGIGFGMKETIPNEADFLLGYATVPGFVSYRSRSEGSWYINALVDALIDNYREEDLMSILTIVNQKLARGKAGTDHGDMGQVPAPVMSLRKKVYFSRKKL